MGFLLLLLEGKQYLLLTTYTLYFILSTLYSYCIPTTEEDVLDCPAGLEVLSAGRAAASDVLPLLTTRLFPHQPVSTRLDEEERLVTAAPVFALLAQRAAFPWSAFVFLATREAVDQQLASAPYACPVRGRPASTQPVW